MKSSSEILLETLMICAFIMFLASIFLIGDLSTSNQEKNDIKNNANCVMEDSKLKKEEITLDDYVLTNINVDTKGYVIRLKDNNEYQIYVRKPRGQKAYDYIIKDGKEIRLNEELRKIVLSEIRVYEKYGI